MNDFPPVPSVAFSHLGPIPVEQDGLPKDEHGGWDPSPRSIKLQADIHIAAKWLTYWHEVTHLAIHDAGIELPDKLEENLCTAIGTYLAAATLAGFLHVKEETPS
jgi:hypothetical protein